MADKNDNSYNINLTAINKGLYTDTNPANQPKDTYRFALNAVNNSANGNLLTVGNELSNKELALLPDNYIILNNTYMSNNRYILFLVSDDEEFSEIGILDVDTEKYITHVNSSELNFKIDKPIDATYRLRLGCEDVVYFTDDYSKPRYFNFNKQNEFKDKLGNWNPNKFELIRSYNSIPKFSKIEVQNFGGKIKAGTYIVIPQYIDENMNPTEFIFPSKEIYINHDSSKKDFREIQGSINSDKNYEEFGLTNKSIKINLSNLDMNYLYYRLAFVEVNNGTGQISKVVYSDIIPTVKQEFIYTGENAVELGTIEEIRFINSQISRAKHITQFDNTLILGTTKGETSDICGLQKYASRIKADCITTTVLLNDINDPRNPKNPTFKMGDMVTGGGGYMPGEIEAFAIVYVFSDGSISPAFHIPGKPLTSDPSTIYNTKLQNAYPMSSDNACKTIYYTDSNSCGTDSFWGLDCDGNYLLGKPVRHHRFPLRSDLGIGFVKEKNASEVNTFKYNKVSLNATGKIETPCTKEMIEAGICSTEKRVSSFSATLNFRVAGILQTLQLTVDPNYYSGTDGSVNQLVDSNLFSYNAAIEFISVTETDDGIKFTEVKIGEVSPKGLIYKPSISVVENQVQEKSFSTEILGINFSNIVKPNIADTGGKTIIGYYIVKAEKTNSDKTIIDSAVILPTIKNKKYIASGLLQPELKDDINIQKDVYAVISPNSKFNDTELEDFDEMIQEGNYNIKERLKSKVRIQDVLKGTSYNSKYHKEGNDDGNEADGELDTRGLDGWCLKVICRDNITEYKDKLQRFSNDKIKKTYNLNALESRDINESKNTVFNISADNKISIIEAKEKLFDYKTDNLPYVYFKRNIDNPYSNFRNINYIAQSLNVEAFDEDYETISLFSGDVVVSPLRYLSSVFWDNTVARRVGKKSVLKKILGVFLIVAAVLVAVFTGGSSLLGIGAGLTLLGAGALSISAGIKMDNYNKAYMEEYEKGLRETLLDDWVNYEYKTKGGKDGPSDDEIQWAGESITNLWFESDINMSLRLGMSTEDPTFLNAPGNKETGNTTPENVWEFFGTYYWNSLTREPISSLEMQMIKKLTVFDDERNAAKKYIGIALGEYYKLNPDYTYRESVKKYQMLPIEYDCCSDCTESFVHRWHWSQQSFQEEKNDNFRIFLPNNYKDIDGETGIITNLFTVGNNLFIHTEEALYKAPKSYQERVTDEIVSFIGTGSLFEIPPQKLVDDSTGHSSGTKHKFGSIKTNIGYFFIDERQNKVIQFNGTELKPISNIGESTWFRDNLEIEAQTKYKKTTSVDYPYLDNIQSPYGTGFNIGYDSKLSRILVTKKDFELSLNSPNYRVSQYKGKLITFSNVNSIIQEATDNGYRFVKYDKDLMIFKRNKIVPTFDERIINGNIVETDTYLYEDDYYYVTGRIENNPIRFNKSWTKSFSLLSESWISYHSYLPDVYINTPNRLLSWKYEYGNVVWEHNIEGKYQTFYNTYKPFILELISNSSPVTTKSFETFSVNLLTEKYNEDLKHYYVVDDIFFNQVIFYNSRQCSGLQEIEIDNKDEIYSMVNSVSNSENLTAIKNDKGLWNINHIRDYRVNYNEPIFNSNIAFLQQDYFIDKILNSGSIDYNKDWTNLSSLKDTYLGVRLHYDKSSDTKLLFNFSIELENNG